MPPFRNQSFRNEWQKENWAKGWLTASKVNKKKAYCNFCEKDLAPGKSELQGHALTELHKKNTKVGHENQTLNEFVTDKSSIKAELNIAL